MKDNFFTIGFVDNSKPISFAEPVTIFMTPFGIPASFAKTPIPQGHHLVYFPPPVPDRSLLPDGTDSLHSPGAPFIKRLWGGGSLVFNQEERLQLVPNTALPLLALAYPASTFPQAASAVRELESSVNPSSALGWEKKVGLKSRPSCCSFAQSIQP